MQLHLYHGAAIKTEIGLGREIALTLETGYPWQGQVKVTIDQADGSSWALSLRIPAWCKGAAISVNGEVFDVPANASSYAVVERAWQVGDSVVLDLPMTPRLLEAHPFVDV